MIKRVLIFGIGKFGSSVATKLLENNEVDLELIDNNPKNLNKFRKYNIPLHSIDSKEVQSIENLGIEEDDYCLLMFGDDITASILTVQNLLDLKIKNIYVRIINASHKKIINSLGITKVIDSNEFIAKQMVWEITKGFSFGITQKDYSVYSFDNQKINNKSMELLNFKIKYQSNIILIKRNVEENKDKLSLIIPDEKTMILKNDEIVVLIRKGFESKVAKLFIDN